MNIEGRFFSAAYTHVYLGDSYDPYIPFVVTLCGRHKKGSDDTDHFLLCIGNYEFLLGRYQQKEWAHITYLRI